MAEPRPADPAGDPGGDPVYRLGSAVVGFIGLLLPAASRARWREEWRGELWHELAAERARQPGGRASVRRRLRLLARCTGAPRDALTARRVLAITGSTPRRRRAPAGDHAMHDLHVAFRHLRGQPAFALVAILTLAVGIGATTAIFTVVDGVLLEPLPYPEPERLVRVGHQLRGDGQPRQVQLTTGAYLVYRDEHRGTLAGLALYRPTGVNLSGVEPPRRVEAAAVTPDLFAILGVAPTLGHGLTPDAEDVPEDLPEAVISHRLWRGAFGGQRAILGTVARVDGRATEIVGVMPPGFAFPEPGIDLWYRWIIREDQARNISFSYHGLGRLAAAATPAQAEADLDDLFGRPFARFRDEGVTVKALRDMGLRVQVQPLVAAVVGDVGTVLWVLMAAVGLILLVACANVANLALVQTERRGRDLALQSALGASRGRLIRQSLIASLLLAVIAGVLGVLLAGAGTRLLTTLGSGQLPRVGEIGLDARVLAFAMAASALSALLFGIAPALRLRLGGLASALRGGAGPAGGSARFRHLRAALVAAQLALALVLLVAAGLMLRTFANLRSVDPGFETERVLLFELNPSGIGLASAAEIVAFHRRVLERVRQLPEVDAATAASTYFGVPIVNPGNANPVWIRDQPPPPGTFPASFPLRIVLPGFFETLGIPLVAGRGLEPRDADQLTGAAVVSASFARAQWGDESPIGKIISPLPDAGWLEVVGVAGEVRQSRLDEGPAPAVYFLPLIPVGETARTYTDPRPMVYAVRTAGEPAAIAAQVRAAVHAVADTVPVAHVRTLRAEVAGSMARTSFTMVLLAIGAAITLLLGVVGMYGVMAYVVSLRTAEIGVRMALGARRIAIQRLVLGHAALVVAIGLVAGVAGALGLTRLLGSLLFGVAPLDGATFGGVSLLLAAVALLASYLPARRASRIDPVHALRAE